MSDRTPAAPPCSADRSGSVPTIVECFGLRLDGGRLVGRKVVEPMSFDPDETASEAIGLRGSPLEGTAILHSTSWRWDHERGIVLTYVCAPDPRGSEPAPELIGPAHGHPHDDQDPSRPGEGEPSPSEVLHHGIDHLAWLADHHPLLVEPSRALEPELWRTILTSGRHRAGRFGRSGGEHGVGAAS